jgi:hypothetical protein
VLGVLGSSAHGVDIGDIREFQLSRAAVLVAAAMLLLCVPGAASAQVAEAWRSSPFHGIIDGGTGRPIPCRCRHGGNAFKLGDTVCMHTHLGVQIARCDLNLNNTSWVPTGEPCTMSRLGRATVAAAAN